MSEAVLPFTSKSERDQQDAARALELQRQAVGAGWRRWQLATRCLDGMPVVRPGGYEWGDTVRDLVVRRTGQVTPFRIRVFGAWKLPGAPEALASAEQLMACEREGVPILPPALEILYTSLERNTGGYEVYIEPLRVGAHAYKYQLAPEPGDSTLESFGGYSNAMKVLGEELRTTRYVTNLVVESCG